MSNKNGMLLPFFLFLVSTSLSSPKWIASGSPADQKPQFKRPDPLSHFHRYNGGFDIRNKHYWSSAAFTGVHGYAIAGVWLLCGLGFGIAVTVKNPSSSSGLFIKHLDHHYFLMFLLLLLFTFLAIGTDQVSVCASSWVSRVASSVVLASIQSTLWRTEKLKRTILKMGGDARQAIQKVIHAMTEMQFLLLPYDPNTSLTLNTTSHRLGRESRIIRSFVDKTGHSFDLAIHTSYTAHLVIVAINLAMVVAALVLLLLHWHPGLTTFADDTCSAFAEFEQNPQNNSLSSLLPCMNPPSAERIMVGTGYTIHTYIAQLNSKITEYYRVLGLDEQSGDLFGVKKICQPFSGAPSYSYMPESCPKGVIQVGDLPNVLARFTCHENHSSEDCESDGKFLPEASYDIVSAFSRSVQYLLDVYPDLQSLTECSFVKNIFSDIVSHQCRPFKEKLIRIEEDTSLYVPSRPRSNHR
ncbi:hypothetical protein CJ030_MR5G024519 [Morella rubra]|uniref:Uncharacterized protein n=1 Tax=Morella rubra TaxID=262757 RepID=A0A6A1VQ69_9ROSI|nr:hypothetical protein CJ030_MR5G024519 [Morella rubra]